MRLIPLRATAAGTTADVIRLVTKNAQQGADIEEFRRRLRILDALDKNSDPAALLLEDADHAELVKALRVFRFAQMDQQMLALLDEITDAKEPARVEKPKAVA